MNDFASPWTYADVENRIEQNLKEDAMWLREHPLIRKELAAKIRAFMWDLETGELKEVE